MQGLQRIDQIFPHFFQDRQWLDAWTLQRLHRNWHQVAGAEIASHSAPAALRGHCLWLRVEHNLWAQELLFRQSELVGKVRAAEPELDIRSIRYVVDPSWFTKPEKAKIPRPESAPPLPDSFAAIPDAASREALARLWRLAHAERHD